MISSKKDLHVLAETTGVVISYCFAVSECLKKWVASEDLTFYGMVLLMT